ncbi:MAG: hypothetical protein GY944_04490 [bacterium]|nr:hypothetical protein [bacterium]
MTATDLQPIVKNPTVIFGLGTAGTRVVQTARETIWNDLGVIPEFVRFVAMDTTDQSPKSAPPLPDREFFSFRFHDVSGLIRQERSRLRKLGKQTSSGDAPIASGEGAGGEAYIASLMLAQRAPAVRSVLLRLLEPFSPNQVANLAARCARNEALKARNITVRHTPKVDVLFAVSTPGGTSGTDQHVLALLHEVAKGLGVSLEVHAFYVLPEVSS